MKHFERQFVNLNLPLYVTYPRSGAIWSNAMFEYYFNRMRVPTFSGKKSLIDHKLVSSEPMWFHTHDVHLDIETKNPLGSFFLIRNPVDAIYSYCRAEKWTLNVNQVDRLYTEWSSLNNKWLVLGKARLCICYEALIENPMVVFENISLFFEVPFNEARAKKALNLSKKEIFLKKGNASKYHGPQLLTKGYASQREKFREEFEEHITKRILNDGYKVYLENSITWINQKT